jgi:SH3 domain protein
VWLLAGPCASATTLYVSDTTLEANLRSGIKRENRIIALLQPGTELTLLDEKEGWAEVELQDGRTGWILMRYLSSRPPWRVTAQRLATEKEQLQERFRELQEEHRALVQENREVTEKLNTQQRELQTIRGQYGELKKGAANYLDLKMAYENLQSSARQNKTRLEDVQKAYKDLKFSTSIRWFLSGAGVLVLGWLVGLSMGRMRRRRSSDLYRI